MQMRTQVIAAILLLPTLVYSLDNGFLRPAMGFNPWNCFGYGRKGTPKFPVSWVHGFNDTVMRQVADAMVSTGLREAGYEYVNLDCGWTTGYRDPKTGAQIVNVTRYPYGMKALGAYIHSKGMKYGIYTSASTSQCCSKFYKDANDGSLDHEHADAQSYVEFGVDYLKFDGCGQEQRSYPAMRDALNASGRHIVLSVNGFDMNNVKNAGQFANSWRTTGDDDHDFVTSLAPRAFLNNEYAQYARPGQFNDADMLEVGNQIVLGDRVGAISHFSLWCIMKSPLIVGTDVTNMTSEEIAVLTNHEAIAINQDALGLQAFVLWRSNETIPSVRKGLPVVPKQSVWAGPLENGCFTVVLLNMDTAPASIAFTRNMLQRSTAHAPEGSLPPLSPSFQMRDIWKKRSTGMFKDKWPRVVESHGVVFLKLAPSENQRLASTIAV